MLFRPICAIRHRICIEKNCKEFVRNKVVRPATILSPKEKLKLYNKDNKELFGPLLETAKEKRQRLKASKNSSIVRQNNSAPIANESVDKSVKFSTKNDQINLITFRKYNPLLPIQKKMWQNTSACVNFVGVLFNGALVRGFKTYAVRSAARSSPAEPGFFNEDKILQIRPHQNDYAQQYPSVTLILNKTMTEESRKNLEKWKQEQIAEMGEEEFKRFYEAQMALGTKLHNTIKTYFTQPRSQLRIDKDVEGVWNSVSDVLKNVSSPKAIESNVVHPVLKYRGVFDAIADYKDKPTLIEWKKSDKPRKSLSTTFDNPVQIAAYFGAVCNDLNYKHLNVRDALLVIAYTDGSKADVYHLSTDKLREHWAQWLIRLEEYMKNHGNNAEKILKGGKRLFEEDIGNL